MLENNTASNPQSWSSWMKNGIGYLWGMARDLIISNRDYEQSISEVTSPESQPLTQRATISRNRYGELRLLSMSDTTIIKLLLYAQAIYLVYSYYSEINSTTNDMATVRRNEAFLGFMAENLITSSRFFIANQAVTNLSSWWNRVMIIVPAGYSFIRRLYRSYQGHNRIIRNLEDKIANNYISIDTQHVLRNRFPTLAKWHHVLTHDGQGNPDPFLTPQAVIYLLGNLYVGALANNILSLSSQTNNQAFIHDNGGPGPLEGQPAAQNIMLYNEGMAYALIHAINETWDGPSYSLFYLIIPTAISHFWNLYESFQDNQQRRSLPNASNNINAWIQKRITEIHIESQSQAKTIVSNILLGSVCGISALSSGPGAKIFAQSLFGNEALARATEIISIITTTFVEIKYFRQIINHYTECPFARKNLIFNLPLALLASLPSVILSLTEAEGSSVTIKTLLALIGLIADAVLFYVGINHLRNIISRFFSRSGLDASGNKRREILNYLEQVKTYLNKLSQNDLNKIFRNIVSNSNDTTQDDCFFQNIIVSLIARLPHHQETSLRTIDNTTTLITNDRSDQSNRLIRIMRPMIWGLGGMAVIGNPYATEKQISNIPSVFSYIIGAITSIPNWALLSLSLDEMFSNITSDIKNSKSRFIRLTNNEKFKAMFILATSTTFSIFAATNSAGLTFDAFSYWFGSKIFSYIGSFLAASGTIGINFLGVHNVLASSLKGIHPIEELIFSLTEAIKEAPNKVISSIDISQEGLMRNSLFFHHPEEKEPPLPRTHRHTF